jgi:hypothetical protein
MVNKQEDEMLEAIKNAQRVMTKAHKRFGVEYPATPTEYLVVIEKNKSIQIYREGKDGSITVCRKFELGDIAEYDSYNLSYLGTIKSISDKSVTIVKTYGKDVKQHRLGLYEFCFRNYRFDLEETRRQNAETSTYI